MKLFTSVPAFIKFAQVNGTDKWNEVEQNFINDLLDILDVPRDTDLSSIVLDTYHDYFVVMGRKSSTK